MPETGAGGSSLYAARVPVFPKAVGGFYRRLKWWLMGITLTIYYVTPWIRWDRGAHLPDQAVLVDLAHRRFFFFWIEIWPQEFYYVAGLLIMAGLGLFLFTSVLGRVWCGYACPQTVWTEAYLWMERKIEGKRGQRMKLDNAPNSAAKIRTKALKHTVWIAFSLWTGFTFVGYFTPIVDLGSRIITFELGPWESFWILFYGFATYGNAGWLREQVCIYMCPYARFQSAMFDSDTLVISYDPARGDPRGARRRKFDHKAAGLGDCIDCTMCVQVCPTGIDIRDGLQYQCIACAACVDACDQVMDQMGYPKGLIRYTTESAVSGEKPRILRPRMVVYAVGLLALVSTLVIAIVSRTPLALDIIRDRNALYRESNEGLVENVYTLKLINMDDDEHVYKISVLGIDGIDGIELDIDRNPVPVAAREILNVSARVRADPYSLKRSSSTIIFTLEATGDSSHRVDEEARFLGPVSSTQQ